MEVKPGYKQTEVGVIPDDWEVNNLQNLGKWIGGGTPSMSNPNFWKNGTIYWASSGDIKTPYLTKTGYKITPEAILTTSTQLIPPNSILIVTRSGILRKYLPVSLNSVSIAINQDIKSIILDKKLDPFFILHLLIFSGSDILKTCLKSGTTVESIEYHWLKRFNIPLPSLSEQTAIATALSNVDALISGLDRLIEKKRAIKQAAMQELLTGKRRLPGFDSGKGYKPTEVGEIPEDWEITSLGVVIKKSQYGLSVVCNTNGKYPILRMNNLKGGYIDLNNLLFTNISVNDYNNYLLNKGDILFNRTNSIDLVGKTSIVREEKNLVFASYLIRLIVDNSKANPFFINILLNKNSIQRTIKNLATKAVSQSNVNVNNLKRIVIHIPSLPEQTAIATVLSDMDAEISALETRRAKTISLKQGMMQELLTGRIRLV